MTKSTPEVKILKQKVIESYQNNRPVNSSAQVQDGNKTVLFRMLRTSFAHFHFIGFMFHRLTNVRWSRVGVAEDTKKQSVSIPQNRKLPMCVTSSEASGRVCGEGLCFDQWNRNVMYNSASQNTSMGPANLVPRVSLWGERERHWGPASRGF